MDRAKEIIIKAKKEVFGLNFAQNLSVFKGDGLDFYEIRDYQIGDDIRKINHKATAKLNQLKVNEFLEEKALNIVIALPLTGSLSFGVKNSKIDFIANIVAMIGFSAIYYHNNLQIILYENGLKQIFIKNEYDLEEVIEYLLSIDLEGLNSSYSQMAVTLGNLIKQKSIFFIIGDFYQKIDFYPLIKHQIYSLIIRDKFEEYPIINDEILLKDLNTLVQKEIVLNKDVAKKYNQILTFQDASLFDNFNNLNIGFNKIYTNEDILIKLKEVLK
jgi:hypothetical protein